MDFCRSNYAFTSVDYGPQGWLTPLAPLPASPYPKLNKGYFLVGIKGDNILTEIIFPEKSPK